jgi:hypothetical protein
MNQWRQRSFVYVIFLVNLQYMWNFIILILSNEIMDMKINSIKANKILYLFFALTIVCAAHFSAGGCFHHEEKADCNNLGSSKATVSSCDHGKQCEACVINYPLLKHAVILKNNNTFQKTLYSFFFYASHLKAMYNKFSHQFCFSKDRSNSTTLTLLRFVILNL